MKIILFTLLLIVTSCKTTAPQKSWASEEQLHNHYIDMFVDARAFGANQMGMILMDDSIILQDKEHLVLDVLLLSITDRDTPVMWLNRSIFNMNHSRSTMNKGRKLNDTEASMFSLLQNGEDLVISKRSNEALMLGALRAQPSCIKCHEDLQVGDLMGAFKYDFLAMPSNKN